MSISQEQIDFALELFDEIGPLTTRKMMGGLCVYHGGTIFAILHSDGTIWLKGQGAFADELTQAGWPRWSYQRDGGKETFMPYWRLPDDLLDDATAACAWANRALAALS